MAVEYKEADLRKQLKNWWGKQRPALVWHEAARGGSVGVPDVDILGVPTELKVWVWDTKGLKADMRPTQIRHHILAAEAGQRTALLIAVFHVLAHEEGDVGPVFYIGPGRLVPRGKRQFRPFVDAARRVTSRADIAKAFGDESFWG